MKEIDKNQLTVKDIAYMMDPSVLKLDTSYEDLYAMIDACKQYEFGCAFAWPAYYPELSRGLKGTNTAFGTSLAFPSGQEATKTKVEMAEYFNTFDPAEHDMVMNVGWLKSQKYEEVLEDLRAVRKATEGRSLKVIIEAMLLTDDEIEKACEIVIASGADYVKTGTGFSAPPTTLHHVELIKKTVGERIKIKVAGGVRDLETLLKMYKRGARRFGIGFASAIKIMQEALVLPGGIADIESVE
ncbi:deoxyribose-phosphate aldolase [Christensenella tenuis]|uniref:Deoxyribose-phosphate aldolase n=1 Tax=Christensenella tenuis TaxID=2763033 RepID=A0ABR7EAK4_9FIRM|nr:deoxyribose-phosphate aldolase [Christensenella tenuis]MBC5646790.1 deoxyribose-phosphate aldolase [Christensenella tenuis]